MASATGAITILDVLSSAASDPGFASRFAREPLAAAQALGMPTAGDRYVEARLAALAQPLGDEPTRKGLLDAAAEIRACFGLDPDAAAVEAGRAALFLRDYRFHQRLLNDGEPGELSALVDRFPDTGTPPTLDGGTLLVTLHYGPFPLLWLRLKHAAHRGGLPPCTLLYDARVYEPDLSPGQYRRLATAGAVPRARRDLDMGAIGLRRALTEAVARLRSGETVLMFADGFPVAATGRSLVCRIGWLDVAYPRGAVWVAEKAGAVVQGVVLRPSGDAYAVRWGTPRAGPTAHAAVANVVQELLDVSVARDPAPWLAWFDDAES